MHGSNEPPGEAPQPESGPPADGAVELATRPGGSGKRLVIGLLCAGAALLVLIAVLAVRLSGDPSYVIRTPPKAGGWVLVSHRGSTLGNDQADARALGIKPDTTASAIYKDPASSSTPPAAVSFLGVTGDVGDPETFLRNTPMGVDSTATVLRTGAGGAGKAMCVSSTGGGTTITLCMWATKHSFGMISPIVAMPAREVASVMRRMRPDLEHAK